MEVLSEFLCEKNADVERFFKEQSIEFTKKNQSVTYLVVTNDDATLVKYSSIRFFIIELFSMYIESSTLSPQEKEDILEDEYGVEMTVDIEGGLKEMCNLSGLIEERGIKQCEEQGRHFERIAMIQKMIQNGFSKEIILGLDYTEDEYAEAEAKLCQLA